jgi:hypothetical protein
MLIVLDALSLDLYFIQHEQKRLFPYCLALLPRLHNPIVAEIIGAN